MPKSLGFTVLLFGYILAITLHHIFNFHATYAGETAKIDIETLCVIAGKLPPASLLV